jgi:hypothetical protein
MTAAIFGLVGVIVGGVLNAAIGSWAERRRAKGERRAMCRLIARELLSVSWGVEEWLRTNIVSQLSREDVLRFPAWKQHHLIAARVIDPAEWDALSVTYLMLYHVRTHSRFTGNLSPDAKLYVENVRAAIDDLVPRIAPGLSEVAWRERRCDCVRAESTMP